MSIGLIAASSFNQEALGGEVLAPAGGVLERIIDGLAFHDNFDRADSDDVGNGWVEFEPAVANAGISASLLHFQEGSNWSQIWRGSDQGLKHPSSSIMHLAARRNIGNQRNQSNLAQFTAAPSGSNNVGYDFNMNVSSGMRIYKAMTGSVAEIAGPVQRAFDNVHSVRSVIEDVGGDAKFLSMYVEKNISDINDITKDFSGGPLLSVFDAIAPTGGTIAAVRRNSDVGHWYVCGRNLEVTGLQSGQKIRFINPAGTGSFVAESGGVAVIDVDQLALPGNRLEVFESDESTLVDAFQSASGIWGGDRYAFS